MIMISSSYHSITNSIKIVIISVWTSKGFVEIEPIPGDLVIDKNEQVATCHTKDVFLFTPEDERLPKRQYMLKRHLRPGSWNVQYKDMF